MYKTNQKRGYWARPTRPILLIMTMAVLVTAQLSAQQANRVITGTVSSSSGEALIGVNIVIKGTSQGTTTDVDGTYTIAASNNDVLLLSYLGFNTQEILVGSATELNVTLEENAAQLNEVVVIGYGTQRKADVTGALSTFSGEEISKYSTSNATQAIQGRMAGVRVESDGGAPGANAIVTIRGSSTLSDAGPLYVIDGMLTGNMNNLNPSDIESVTVLKDASASAIYGSRAANGVVIVTTKKGRNGEIGVELDLSYSSQKATNTLDWANARQYADIVNRARDNDGNPRFPANDEAFNPSVDTDIQAATLRTAPMFNANMRIFGGTENSSFSISANHLDQTGILRNSDFTRSSLRINSSFRKGKFKVEETVGLTRIIDNPNNLFNRERDIIPTVPLRDEDGNFSADVPAGVNSSLGGYYGPGNIANSLGRATIEDRTVTRNNVLGSVAASYEIVEGLTYKLNLGLEYSSTNNYTFTPEFFFNGSPVGNTTFAELKESNTNFISPLMEHTLNYKKYVNKHSLDFLAGYTVQESNSRRVGLVARTFPSNDIRVASAAEDLAQALAGDFTSTILSSFGRINYTYDDRYILTATLRRDGSSLFKEGLRWGTFPSLAVGWNISKESFMSDLSGITNVKLRASYGEIGSNNVPIYSTSPELNLFSEYVVGSSQERATGYSITKGVNPNITWETTKTTDIGLEFDMIDNRLHFTMDYFIRNSEDVLVQLSLPLYTGFGNAVPFNTANIKNKGFEFLADYAHTVGKMNFNIGANFTIISNEVTALGESTPIIGGGFTSNGLRGTKTDIGQPVGSFFGYIVDGIYQTDAEAMADNSSNSPQAGDFKFRDLNNDGMINEEDQTYIGNPSPDFEYGLSFSAQMSDFDVTLFFNGVAGNEILNGNRYRGYFDTEGNYLADAINAWTPSNTDTDIPRNTLSDPGFNRRMSDFYLENGSYFRLRNIQIGYKIGGDAVEKLGMSHLRLYLSAQNLFTITDYTGYYPEVGRNNRGSTTINNSSSGRLFNSGVDESAYPSARTIQFGVQASF